MLDSYSAMQEVASRGPQYAVIGNVRPGEARVQLTADADAAERTRDSWIGSGYYQVRVFPPLSAEDLTVLAAERDRAAEVGREATARLKAGVLRALEEGRSEAEVARTAGIDRMTLRAWAGK